MRDWKNKTTAIMISIFLMLVMTTSLVALPVAKAQTDMKTYAYIGAVPNPAGVGQDVLLHVGITTPLSSFGQGWEDMSVTIEKPDATTQTLTSIRTDSTGGTGVTFTPDQEGIYKLQTHFPETVTTEDQQARRIPVGTVMPASDSEVLELVVQAEPAPYFSEIPLPAEYWTRPLDAQAREWYTIAGSWLYTPRNLYTPYNDGPETAHILWTKPITTGGIAGGALGTAEQEALGYHGIECGDAYEGKWGGRGGFWGSGPVIVAGKLYYRAGAYDRPQITHCVDLRTGEELWAKTFLDNRTITEGQLFYWDSYNYHGVYPYLWVVVGGTWNAFDAATGNWMFTVNNVPSGTTVYGPKGGIYRYSIDTGTARMLAWNMSALGSMHGSWGRFVHLNTLDAGEDSEAAQRAWCLNTSIPTDLSGSVRAIFFEDRVIGASVTQTEVSSWGVSLKPGDEGDLLFKKTWTPPASWAAENVSISWVAISSSGEDGVFVVFAREHRKFFGFSTETGDLLWETEPEHYLNTYVGTECLVVYDMFISTGVSGITYAYDAITGDLLWEYHAVDPYQEILWANDWWTKPMFVTDGKLYLAHMEHSSIDPKPRGAPFICLNATTGEEIWRSNGLFRQTYWGARAIIGDSVIATMDTYDQRVYAIGKGPSYTTVTAPNIGVPIGKGVLISGSVTDVSPGTEEYGLRARFPDGVPAVCDDNMSDWMLYVYKQFPQPADVMGVDVIVTVLDPNGNVYEVATTTCDAKGFYRCTFTPPVPGLYTIVATFAGSEAFYASSAEASLYVEEGTQPTAVPTATPAPMTDMYVLGLGGGAIVAIVVIGLILILMLRKR